LEFHLAKQWNKIESLSHYQGLFELTKHAVNTSTEPAKAPKEFLEGCVKDPKRRSHGDCVPQVLIPSSVDSITSVDLITPTDCWGLTLFHRLVGLYLKNSLQS
jgi:hypothetical protein